MATSNLNFSITLEMADIEDRMFELIVGCSRQAFWQREAYKEMGLLMTCAGEFDWMDDE